mmetsp:Transcript_106954/g.255246  ORF Transcript_106954/g.255246 Transcript_106954/m.255246 type:complete len:264 (-) Transcript_106954:362-1153(-)
MQICCRRLTCWCFVLFQLLEALVGSIEVEIPGALALRGRILFRHKLADRRTIVSGAATLSALGAISFAVLSKLSLSTLAVPSVPFKLSFGLSTFAIALLIASVVAAKATPIASAVAIATTTTTAMAVALMAVAAALVGAAVAATTTAISAAAATITSALSTVLAVAEALTFASAPGRLAWSRSLRAPCIVPSLALSGLLPATITTASCVHAKRCRYRGAATFAPGVCRRAEARGDTLPIRGFSRHGRASSERDLSLAALAVFP